MSGLTEFDMPDERRELERFLSAGIELKRGDKVRLWPRNRADIIDMALTGMAATIAAIEQDMEDRIYVAVTVDEDPGNELGQQGQVGHRFFFAVDEVELIDSPARSKPERQDQDEKHH